MSVVSFWLFVWVIVCVRLWCFVAGLWVRVGCLVLCMGFCVGFAGLLSVFSPKLLCC